MTDNTALPPNIANDTVSKPTSEQPTTTQDSSLNMLAPQPPSTASSDDALSVKNPATTTLSVNGKAEELAKRKDGGTEKGIGVNANEMQEEDGEFEIEDTAASNAAAAATAAATANSGTSAGTTEIPVQLDVAAQVQTASQDPPQFETPLKKRRGRPPGSGRKRKIVEVDTEPADDQEWKPLKDETEGGTSEYDHDGGEEDDEAKITKFGRKVQKPIQFNTTLLTPGNSAVKRPYHRRQPGSQLGGSIICTVCHRGHSPKTNRIVLCDNCDRPYHQQCHNPIVEDLIVSLTDAKWYCAQCERGRKKKKVETEITGVGIGLDQKKAYLLSLPKSSLVDLVLFAEKHRPDLKLYPAYLKADSEIATAAIAVTSTVPDAVDGTPIFDIPLYNAPYFRTPHTKHISDGDGDEYAEGEAIGSPSEVPFSRDFEQLEAEGVPSYEDMIAKALTFIADPKGTQPKDIWEWMSKNYPLAENFSRSASQSLLKAIKKGRFMKEDGLYKLNPAYVPDPAKSRRGARKPSFVKSDGTVVTPSKKPISSPRKKSKESAADDGSRRNGNTEANAENKEVGKVPNEIRQSGIEFDLREGASSQVHQQQLRPIVAAATMEPTSTIATSTIVATTTASDEDDSNIVSIPAAATLPSIANTLFQPAVSHSLNGTPAATAPLSPGSHIASFQAPQHFPVPSHTNSWTGNPPNN